MGLDELLGGNGRVEDLGKLLATLRLYLSRSVCEENVWDFDAELVVAIQDFQHPLSFWDQSVSVYQDSVDVECKSHVFGGAGLLSSHILNLAGKDISGGLNGWHAGSDGRGGLD